MEETYMIFKKLIILRRYVKSQIMCPNIYTSTAKSLKNGSFIDWLMDINNNNSSPR
jgi:hypothetical protein